LQEISPAAGMCVSSRVHEDVRDRLDIAFEDGGAQVLKNIARPVHVWRWLPNLSSPSRRAADNAMEPVLPLPDKPSIAVLPFQNMSGDADQEYFTDGVTEDIITELSRFHSLFVIARNSSFSYKGKSPDIRQVGRELGVRYVLEGSIRRSSNRIRVTGQLIDTLTGNHIWAERYDRVLEDIFAVQEEVTRAIVAAIAPQIDSVEESKAKRRRPDNLSAYEMALRARVHTWEGHDKADRTLLDQSIREAKEVLAMDPDSVLALHALAFACGASSFLGMAKDREGALREAMSAAARAVELDGTNPLGYALRGFQAYLSLQLERYPDALADARRAHEMNPNDTIVLEILAHLEVGVGEPEQAIEHAQQVLRLSPRQSRSHMTYNLLAYASHGAKQYAKGIEWASRALGDMPRMVSAQANLAVSLVGAGEIDKAKAVFSAGQRLAPEYFRDRLEGTLPLARLEHRRRVQTFLRIAAGLEDPSAAEALR
jgi:adenylate cyclase